MEMNMEFDKKPEKVDIEFKEVNLVPTHPDSIRYSEQELTEEQKKQARENIGAVSSSEVELPEWIGETKPEYTPEEVGADTKGSADRALRDAKSHTDTQLSGHNTAADTHSDIRLLISEVAARLNAIADSDDITLDQLSEVVAYIKNNKDLIGLVTTDKISYSAIINNLTTNVPDKPLSAGMGVVLKAMIDDIEHTWATLPDKPFGEEIVYGDTLTWDGNTEGLECVNDYYYKVSSASPALEEMMKGGLIKYNTQDVYDVSPLDITQEEGYIDFCGDVIIRPDGVYFYYWSDDYGTQYVSSITIYNYTGFSGSERTVIEPLPNKYLDLFTTRYGVGQLSWDGNIDGLTSAMINGIPHFKVSDVIITENDFQESRSYGVYESWSMDLFSDYCENENGILLTNCCAFVNTEESGLPMGVYFRLHTRHIFLHGCNKFNNNGINNGYVPIDLIDSVVYAKLMMYGLING